MEYATLNNGVKMPMAGIGTFLLTPDEAEASCVSALRNGYRLIDTANAYGRKFFSKPSCGPASMSSPMRWTRPLPVWTLPTSTCC